jgi:hypothetical protein
MGVLADISLVVSVLFAAAGIAAVVSSIVAWYRDSTRDDIDVIFEAFVAGVFFTVANALYLVWL